jgi:hypothetical protein
MKKRREKKEKKRLESRRRRASKNVVYYIEKNCLGMMGFPYIYTHIHSPISNENCIWNGEGELMMRKEESGKGILSIFYDFDP